MKIDNPTPLYPTATELTSLRLGDYPSLNAFLAEGPAWRNQHWQWGLDFLKYIGRNKSEHTYVRFRNEMERFLLWVFIVKQQPMDELRKTDILEYADFCWKPPLNWISLSNHDRFVWENGAYAANKKWLPFRLTLNRQQQTTLDTGDTKAVEAEKKKYRPSQQTLHAMFTGVIAFYKYLMGEEICYGNPAQVAKKDCRYFIADAQVKDVRRLTEEQWNYALETAEKMAEHDAIYERNLFIVASLKTLFLRISELSERTQWSPAMNHFWQDDTGNWWLKIYGKGRKLRDVTVPDQYLPYLKRYRQFRGLSGLPGTSDYSPLVEKIRGQGGMTSRHLARLVQEVFNQAYENMKAERGEDAAAKLREASTHWLRHTGASMEIERGRALKDVSEDLGHASMATTDTVYVQSENKKRAASGKTRSVSSPNRR